MKLRDVERRLAECGCSFVRQRGSHRVWKSPKGCTVAVPSHAGEDLKTGTLHGIERSMEPCLGKGWLLD